MLKFYFFSGSIPNAIYSIRLPYYFIYKTIIFCDELRLSPLISDFHQELNAKDIAIVVGPEGGFDDSERDYIQTNIENLIECSLGPRIYRAETAALVALALFQ